MFMTYRNKLGRFVVTLVVFSLVTAFAAFSFASEKILYFSYSKDIGLLNPHSYGTPFIVQNMLYEPLIKYDEKGELVPWLAESWTESANGKEYTFHLRKGVKFSDGSDFNAKAVKINFDAVMMNRKKYNWLELIKRIKETLVIDENTFKLILNSYYYPALQELALFRPFLFLSPSVFPKSGNTADGIKAPVGTGQWILNKHKKGEYAVFERNPYYWRKKPALDKIYIKVIPDSQSRALVFEAGEIDLIFGGGYVGGVVSMDTFKYLKEYGEYKTAISQPWATRTIVINSKKKATKDLKVRMAIQHAVNKEAISRGVFYGIERKADSLLHTSIPYCNIELLPYEYNIEKAAMLMEESGWKLRAGKRFREKEGRKCRLDLSFLSTNPIHKSMAEVIQSDLVKMGIDVRLSAEEMHTFVNRWKTGEFDLTIAETWGAPYDPHSMMSSMRSVAHADYHAQSGLPMKKEIDAAITKLLLEKDRKTRKSLYEYVLKTLHEQAVYLPITYLSSIAIYHPKLMGVHFGPTMYEIPFGDMDLK